MRASANVKYATLVACVENSLSTLNYGHLKHTTKLLTEFEVESPCHFRVIVEDAAGEKYGFALLMSEKNESVIEILPTLGAQESDDVLRQHVASLVGQVRKTLPREPWKGLGVFRSRSERVKWSELERRGAWQD